MRVVLRIEIEGEAQLAHTLEGVSGSVADLSDAWRFIARNVVYPSIALNFAMEGRPERWPELSEAYAKWKLRTVGPVPILQLHGGLVTAMTTEGSGGGKVEEIEPHSLTIGIERGGPIFYGIFHTSRRPRRTGLPRRQFLMLQPEDAERTIRAVQEHIMSRGRGI